MWAEARQASRPAAAVAALLQLATVARAAATDAQLQGANRHWLAREQPPTLGVDASEQAEWLPPSVPSELPEELPTAPPPPPTVVRPATEGVRRLRQGLDWLSAHAQRQSLVRDLAERPYFVVLTVVVAVCSVIAARTAWTMHRSYTNTVQLYIERGKVPPHMFSSYFLFRFSFWFNWNDNSYKITMVSIFTTFCLLGTFVYCFIEGVGTPVAGLKVFVWLINPDGGVLEQTPGGRLVGFLVSFGGLMIFAFVISAVHTGFDDWLQGFRDGLDPVVETDHIVILGNNDALLLLLDELCKAYAPTGGQSIVVLCETPKQVLEDSIMASRLDHRNSKIVVRTGTATDVEHLACASVATCSKVVVLPDLEKEPEYRDAFAFQVLYALRGQGWPLQGTVLVVCSLMRNEALLRELGGTAAQVLLLGAFVAKLMTLSSRGWGLGETMREMLSNSGDNFHVCSVPTSLVGETFLDASVRFPDAVLIGVVEEAPSSLMCEGVAVTVLYDFLSDNPGAPELLKRGLNGTVLSVSEDDVAYVAFARHRDSQEIKKSSWRNLRVQGFVPDADIILCPDPHRKLEHSNALVLLSGSEEGANDVCPQAASEPSSPRLAGSQEVTPFTRRGSDASAETSILFSQGFRSPEGEVILFLGFNEWIGLILLQLDSMVQAGSHVIIYDSQSKDDREGEIQRMHQDWDSPFTNIRVTHVEGAFASHYELEDLLGRPIEEDRRELVHEVKRVFVLLPKALAHNVAGAWVLLMAAKVRAIMLDHGVSKVPVIPQVSDLHTRVACEGAGMWDCVSTSELEAKILAMHVANPVLGSLMRQLTSDNDASFIICRLADNYAAISFHQMSNLVMHRGMVLLGWTDKREGLYGLEMSHMILNPPNKHKLRFWKSGRDRILVMSRETEEPAQAVQTVVLGRQASFRRSSTSRHV